VPPFGFRRGTDDAEALTFEELRHAILDLAKRGVQVQRFKGLGEMNADQLWETTMNPATRALLQVHPDNAAEADHMFTTLMGEKVGPRKDFIRAEATKVQNLDV
jgi:DNA gyrase subunit B